MSLPVLCTPIDYAYTTLASDYTAGSGTMTLVANPFGSPTSQNPVRVMLISDTFASYVITSITGLVATVAVHDGYTDQDFPLGATVGCTDSAGTIKDIHAYLNAGIQGPQGANGSQGPQGAQGYQGSQGLQGSQGFQGAGAQGYQGSQGLQGAQGANGSQGPQGFQGGTGSQGTQGAQGSGVAAGTSGSLQYNNAGSFGGTAHITTDGSQTINIGNSTNSYVASITTSGITTSAPNLVLSQTGDIYGETSLTLLNGNNTNGAIFANYGVTLVDFIFNALGTQRNIRYQSNQYVAFTQSPEFQFGSPNYPSFVTGDNGLIANAAFTINSTIKIPTGAVNNYVLTSDASGNATWKSYSPPQMADSAATNGTLYYSTTGSSLAYKTPSGTVQYLS
jgi:hypothetical protein